MVALLCGIESPRCPRIVSCQYRQMTTFFRISPRRTGNRKIFWKTVSPSKTIEVRSKPPARPPAHTNATGKKDETPGTLYSRAWIASRLYNALIWFTSPCEVRRAWTAQRTNGGFKIFFRSHTSVHSHHSVDPELR